MWPELLGQARRESVNALQQEPFAVTEATTDEPTCGSVLLLDRQPAGEVCVMPSWLGSCRFGKLSLIQRPGIKASWKRKRSGTS